MKDEERSRTGNHAKADSGSRPEMETDRTTKGAAGGQKRPSCDQYI